MTASTKKSVYPVAPKLSSDKYPRPHYDSFEKYREDHLLSITKPQEFWSKKAKELLTWDKPFTKVLLGSLQGGDVKWFEDGSINACYNCVDRHAIETPDKVALIYEADEPNQSIKVTYRELLSQICQLSNLLLSWGLKKGDSVTIYMPMVPQAVVSILACARIGVLHSVVFAGFSAQSLSDRIKLADSKILITSDEGKRGGKVIPLKKIADEAAAMSPCLKKVLVYRRTKNPHVKFAPGRDYLWDAEVPRQSTECPHIPSNSEDPLFLLFTSGSTGAPKGIQHTTAGYLLGAAASTKYVFDTHPGDVFGCTADIGWITGHTCLAYGPLALGLTTVIFESIPTYPNASRFWQLVDDHKITQFYTSPTAIRSLRKLGDEWVNKHHLETIRTIGTAGEPINPEAWEWYYNVVGKGQCALVDTYWQTETGSAIITPFPGATPTKPGAASFPFLGIDPVILDSTTGQVLEGNDVTGVLAIRQPWPSMARTIYKDHQRYLDTYFNPYKGFYFTGDGASRDHDGHIWIRGRVDDVINVSGHRLSTSEIESALILNPAVAESAVVGIPDAVTGQAICAFVTLKPSHTHLKHADLTKELVQNIRSIIGPFATPKKLVVCEEVPKTRSGKIIRRILRKIMSGESDSIGDLSTVSDPPVVDNLIKLVSKL
ncbi:acetate--CoA ligase [Conidiobolus coronatus NRRL 28638]|uniref:Acetyl-coenzyme A synthetase n=1 Tax=Conidiobolus coronatus (strain ATCC 28846 / CBS 209.66 / NRRL 28638) TaxID=796925 RepID=A0A137P1H4_CONC2|nr:acetate--CoA ligase [Conidiobolus coronatus NRRL 28638]|eukprot:KXN68862.1 acetate--CoA ligase [Conidiobolus coronatus NRRL 28638]